MPYRFHGLWFNSLCVSGFWMDSSSTFGSSGLSFQHYSRPYIGIICTRLSRAQETNPSSMSVSEFVEGGTFSVSVFSFWVTRFLLPLWYLLRTNCFTRPAVKVFRLLKSAGRLFLLAAQLLTVHPNTQQSIGFPAPALFHPLLIHLPVLLENQPQWSSDKTRDAEKINSDSEKKKKFYFSGFYICFNRRFAFLILWSESKLSSQEELQMFIFKDVLLKAASSGVP